ncbi:MAG: hypothetical protein WCP73_07175 [Eubacteriales bacterium]
MKKELDFINIEGFYGGDQNWYRDRFMRMAGCSAVCASEACAYLAGHFPALRKLYPGDPDHIRKEEFVSFMKTVFKYVTPGFMGMSSIKRFKRCFLEYACAAGADVRLTLLGGEAHVDEAKSFVKRAMDAGYCVLYLLLTHKDKELDEFTWHWFTLTGYVDIGESMQVDFATWGNKHSFDFDRMWNTGTLSHGGMVVITEPASDF